MTIILVIIALADKITRLMGELVVVMFGLSGYLVVV